MRQYAGNDSLFPISFGIVDDGDDDTALNRNVSAEALGDRTAWARARVLSVAALSWPFRGAMPGSNLQMLTAPIYDRFRERWVAAVAFDLAPFYWSHDGGATWTPFGALLGSAQVIALGAHPTTGRILAFSRGACLYNDAFDGFWAGGGNHTMGDPASVDRIHFLPSVGLFVAVGAATNPAKAHIATSPDGQTWTSHDDQIPASLAQDAAWATAAGPSRILACPRAQGRSTYMTSKDAVTWQPITVPATSDESVQDVAYNPMFDEFVVALITTTAARFVATQDGKTWQTRATISNWYPLRMAVCSGAWVALGKSREQTETAQLRCSFDGGVTWRLASASLPGSQAPERYQLASSGGQCIATDGATAIISSQNLGL